MFGLIGNGGVAYFPGMEPQKPLFDVDFRPLVNAVEKALGLGKGSNVVEGSGPGSTSGSSRPVSIYSHPVGGQLGSIVEGVFSPGKGGVYNLGQEGRESPPDPRRHWAVLVGDVFHELNADINLNVLYQNGRVDGSTYKWEKFTVGWTKYDDVAIMNAGEEVIKHMRPGYNLYDNNCQKFVIDLLEKICEPGREKVITSYSYLTQTKMGVEIPFLSSHAEATPKEEEEEEVELPTKSEGLARAGSIMDEHTPRIHPNDLGTLGLKDGTDELVVVHRA
ncbi:hypothetical protein BKA70DRAFT_1217554 [Coprinopsis sp. MPI-PUGE-AT-0042]|nr:hypothetical protein BKA70DRAFT_1217554 [Coprinopsis sp. MPI-PUGE-AT-0042]